MNAIEKVWILEKRKLEAETGNFFNQKKALKRVNKKQSRRSGPIKIPVLKTKNRMRDSELELNMNYTSKCYIFILKKKKTQVEHKTHEDNLF